MVCLSCIGIEVHSSPVTIVRLLFAGGKTGAAIDAVHAVDAVDAVHAVDAVRVVRQWTKNVNFTGEKGRQITKTRLSLYSSTFGIFMREWLRACTTAARHFSTIGKTFLPFVCFFVPSSCIHSAGFKWIWAWAISFLSLLCYCDFISATIRRCIWMTDGWFALTPFIIYSLVFTVFFFFCLRSFTMFPLSVSLRNRSVPLQFPLCSVFFYTARAFWFVRSVFFLCVSVFVIFHRHQAAALAIVILRCFWAEAFCNSFITHCSVCS